ncbi:hypothetical protein [Pseudomonas sp. NFX183]|uniref:hypothetical protein n=1 Tax=Pseudomonas sp. NFX183 TaxID=3399573 RepID=UPI003A5C0C22
MMSESIKEKPAYTSKLYSKECYLHDHASSARKARIIAEAQQRSSAAAQQRGEVRPGGPSLYAFSVLGPIVASGLFQEMFGLSSPYAHDLQALAKQHGDTVVGGMLVSVD